MGEAPRKVSAKALAEDVRSGISDEAMAEKYGITKEKLQDLLYQLVEKGILDGAELDVRCRQAEYVRTKSAKHVEPEGDIQRQGSSWKRALLIRLAVYLLLLVVGATIAWKYYDGYKRASSDRAASADAQKLKACLQRLASELNDLGCLEKNPEVWKLTERHLATLVGPYYGFRGTTWKAEVRARIKDDQIWVCAKKGTKQGDDGKARWIYRFKSDLSGSSALEDLPPIVGPCYGKRYPITRGDVQICFTESMAHPLDCSFRLKRPKPTHASPEQVKACEERREKDTGLAEAFTKLSNRTINPFSVDLYRTLATGDDNLVFSPFSLFCPLAMDYEGARGETREEIAQVLHIEGTSIPLHATLGSLMEYIKCSVVSADGELRLASALWGNKGYGFDKTFQEVLRKNYGTGIKEFDSGSNPAEIINAWVETQTNGRVKNIVGDFSPDVGLLLANAIYFNCDWENKFPIRNTEDREFTLLDRERIKVPTMHKLSGEFQHMETGSFQALEMEYSGKQLSMVIFLPREKDGLPEFEKNISADGIIQWTQKLEPWPAGVDAYIPRFFIMRKFGMPRYLKSLGMRKAFERFGADFTGISGPRPPQDRLYTADVIHEAGIDVSEEGTEAWAATIDCKMISGCDGSPERDPKKPIIFRADHPFMFLIRHNPSNCIVFMGRVTMP